MGKEDKKYGNQNFRISGVQEMCHPDTTVPGMGRHFNYILF